MTKELKMYRKYRYIKIKKNLAGRTFILPVGLIPFP